MAEAYVTLVTNNEYVHPASVLAHSLRKTNTTRPVVVVITDDVSESKKRDLKNVFDQVVRVEKFDSGDVKHLALLGRPELGVTFTKLRVWTLTDFSKCVFLDADTIVLQNIDELFQQFGIDELSASPDAGWPDMFNSGVFVFRPSLVTYQAIINFAATFGSFDGGDQGLLNDFFPSWKRLAFIYNMTINASYGYAPAYERFKHAVKVIHFAGVAKPWRSSATRTSGDSLQQIYNTWWSISDSLNVSTSLSASYKTVMASPRPKSPSVGSSSSPWASAESFRSPHDVRRPLGDYSVSTSAEHVVDLIKSHIVGTAVRSPEMRSPPAKIAIADDTDADDEEEAKAKPAAKK